MLSVSFAHACGPQKNATRSVCFALSKRFTTRYKMAARLSKTGIKDESNLGRRGTLNKRQPQQDHGKMDHKIFTGNEHRREQSTQAIKEISA